MSGVTVEAIRVLREKTGAGMMDCKKALNEAGGDEEKAIDVLRQKGLATAAKKAGRDASQGAVGSYIHMGGKIGVLVEINCETDFVARTDDFQGFVKDVAMHIAAAAPLHVTREDVSEEELAREKEIYRAQLLEQGKPENMVDKIVEGKIQKFFAEICLVDQVYVKDPDGKQKVGDLVTEMVSKLGENIVIRRFDRFVLGEQSS